MALSFKIVKLTKQYNGHDQFTHRVEFRSHRRDDIAQVMQQWVDTRIWLWSHFGPSAELAMAQPKFFDGEQPLWSWDSDKFCVYLRDEAFTMFSLRKERFEMAK
jgi:hypothetical protein